MTRSPWFPLCRPREEARLRLFCFAFAGGGASVYREWPGRLPDDVEVRAVQLPGRENRVREAPLTSVEDAVAQLLPVVAPLLDRPWAVFGHSLGARLGFALARALVDTGHAAPTRLFASGSGGPHLAPLPPLRADLPDEDFAREVFAIGGTPEAVQRHPELMELLLPMLRADFRMSETYRAPVDVRAPCPVGLFLSEEDVEVPATRVRAWREVAEVDSERVLPGGHFFLQSEREAVCAAVAEDLAR